jgi:hypothetical protein
VTAAVVVPVAFTAVSVYTVVAAGDTTFEVPVTAPMPEIESEAALVVLHESVEFPPASTLVGLAVNELIVGAGSATVAPQVVVAMVDDASVTWNVML